MSCTSCWINSCYLVSELIITSGGVNIAPVPIEDRIKKEVPFLSNVMVVGDNRNYLTCLVTLKVSVCLNLENCTFLRVAILHLHSFPPPPPPPPPLSLISHAVCDGSTDRKTH